MRHLQKATHLTSGAADDADLTALYAYPPAPAPTVRANMIASIDGSAVMSERSGGLGGEGDRELFGVLRSLADVVLVGSGTANAERYRSDPSVPVAIVSASLNIDAPVLDDPRTIVLTCADAPADRRALLRSADVTLVDCGADRVDLASAVAALAARGHTKILAEGGPTMLGRLLADNLVDELCVTTGPLAVGGTGTRITAGPDSTRRFTPVHVLTDDDGYLYARWIRVAAPDD